MTRFAVPELNCDANTQAIENALSRMDPDVSVVVHVDARILEVETNVPAAAVLSVLSQAGYAANVAG